MLFLKIRIINNIKKMKAKEVLKLLNIARVTLHNYAKNEIIKIDSEVNGFYNEDSVYSIINKNIKRKRLFIREEKLKLIEKDLNLENDFK